MTSKLTRAFLGAGIALTKSPMGIASTSRMRGRAAARADLTAGAVYDDSRQGDDHADDAEQVRHVRNPRVAGSVLAGDEVSHHVENAGRDEDDDPGSCHGRQRAEVAQEAAPSFYHQHMLVIHRDRSGVNSITNNNYS